MGPVEAVALFFVRGSSTTDVLVSRPGRQLYHACQLREFESYLLVGAVLCRADLRALGAQACTPRDSDAEDFERGDLDHVFGTLDDRGWPYQFLLGVPDVCGPIQLEFDIAALAASSQLTVRDRGSLGDARRCSAEIEAHGRRMSLLHLRRVVVLPLVAGGSFLCDVISEVLDGTLVPAGVAPEVVTRDVVDEHLDGLVEWAACSSDAAWQSLALPAFIVTWMRHVAAHRHSRAAPFKRKAFERELRRFARYLEHGTLSRMRGEAGFLR